MQPLLAGPRQRTNTEIPLAVIAVTPSTTGQQHRIGQLVVATDGAPFPHRDNLTSASTARPPPARSAAAPTRPQPGPPSRAAPSSRRSPLRSAAPSRASSRPRRRSVHRTYRPRWSDPGTPYPSIPLPHLNRPGRASSCWMKPSPPARPRSSDPTGGRAAPNRHRAIALLTGERLSDPLHLAAQVQNVAQAVQ